MVGPDDVGIDWAGEPGAMAAEPRNGNAMPGGGVSGMDEEGGEEEAEGEEVERAVTPPLAHQFERVAPPRPLKQRPGVLDPLRNAQSMGLRRLKPRVRKADIADGVSGMVQNLGVGEDGARVDNVLMAAFRNRLKRRRGDTDEGGIIPAAQQFRAASRTNTAALPAAGPDHYMTYDFGQGAAAGAAATPGRPAAGAADGGTAGDGSQWNLRDRQEYGSDDSGEDSE